MGTGHSPAPGDGADPAADVLGTRWHGERLNWVPPSCKASYLLLPRRDRSWPSLCHVTRGAGHPSAWHCSAADPFRGAFTSSGPGWMRGATAAAPTGKGENEQQSSEEKSNPTRASFPIAPSIGDPKILHISVPDERDAQGTRSPPAKPRGRAMLTVNFHLEALPAVPRCGASPADVLPPVCCPHVPDPQEPSLGQGLPVGIPLTDPGHPRSAAVPTGSTMGLRGGGPSPAAPPAHLPAAGSPPGATRCRGVAQHPQGTPG